MGKGGWYMTMMGANLSFARCVPASLVECVDEEPIVITQHLQHGRCSQARRAGADDQSADCLVRFL